MEANTTTASPVIPASAPISQGRATEGVQSRGDQGDSSAAFSQRTNVSIETAIDHLADILSKVSGRQQTNVQQMPQELKEVIQNMIRQSFSLETTLAQGLGSTAASQRFSTDQLTTLARTLNQLGTMAETGNAPQVGDELAALLTGLKSALAKEASGTFEPIMLTKAAFQLLDTGNAELLPKELKAFLPQLNAQGGAQAALLGNAGSTSLSFLNQLVQLLMPREVTGGAAQTALQNPAGGQDAQIASLAKNANTAMIEEPALDQQMPRAQTSASATDALAKENTTATLRQAGNMPQESVAKTPGAPAQNCSDGDKSLRARTKCGYADRDPTNCTIRQRDSRSRYTNVDQCRDTSLYIESTRGGSHTRTGGTSDRTSKCSCTEHDTDEICRDAEHNSSISLTDDGKYAADHECSAEPRTDTPPTREFESA